MSTQLRKPRNGNIDLIRILATFLILIGHFVPKSLWNGNEQLCGYMETSLATMDPNGQIMMLYITLAEIGDVLYLLCSAWFLLDSRHCNVKRLLSLEFDQVALGAAWLAITALFGLSMSKDYVIINLFPTSHNTYWFFSCYVLIYLLHPAFNVVLDHLDKKQLLTVDLLLLFLYSVMQLFMPNSFYFNPLVGLTTIYFYAAYLKKYLPEFSRNRKANVKLMIVSGVILILFNLAKNVLGVHVEAYQWKMGRWNNYINLFVITMGIGIFNFFRTMPNIKSTAFLTRISSLSLIVYVITESPFMRFYFKPWFYDWIWGRFDYSYIWLYVLMAAAVAYVIAAACGTLYQILFKTVKEKVADGIIRAGKALYEKAAAPLLRLE